MPLSAAAASDPLALRAAFGGIPQGVSAIGALDRGGRPRGLAASSFTSVSLDPPLVSVCMANTSTTWPVLRALPAIGVSVLSDTQAEASRALAARLPDRFADIHWYATAAGAVLLEEAVLRMECTLEAEVPAGDHTLVLLRIDAYEADPARAPLVFHASRFRRLEAPDHEQSRRLEALDDGQSR